MKTFLLASVFFGLISMQTVCEAKNKMKNIAETYKGDGVASYIKKPAFFASDGVRVDFETFSLSEGFNKELLISGLPSVKHNSYAVYFFPNVDKKLGKDITNNIFIRMTLKTEDGVVLWSVDTQLNSWVETTVLHNEARRNVYHYYHESTDYKDRTGRLVPDEDMNYTLLIQCRLNGALEKTIEGNARFFLRAGGYK